VIKLVRVEMRNITKRYGKIVAIKDLNLTIKDGEYIAVLGPTGAGKTTTMYILAGLVQPTEGRILFDGKDVTDLPAEDRNVGFVFEEYNLFPRMTVEENVLFGPRVKALDINESRSVAKELFHLLNIAGKENNYPNEISGGQKQRVALARAIVSNAQLLIMDDPLRALDAKIREMLQIELRNLVKDLGLTCIHATHDIHEAMRVADKIAVFQQGRMVQFGTPNEIYNHPKTLEIATFLSECNVFEGIIKIKDNKKVLMLKNDIEFIVDTNLPNNTEVRAALPTELVDIYKTTEKEELNYDNIIPAQLVKQQCSGEFYTFLLSLDDDIAIKGKELVGKSFHFKNNETVLFATDKDDFRVYKKDNNDEKESNNKPIK